MSKAIRVSSLRKSFGSFEVLRGVSIEADHGSVTSIIGSSGSGKSTLLRCIPLLEVPDSGEIAINGEAIAMRRDRTGRNAPASSKQVNRLRSQLGFVFQSFNLWPHRTVLENVTEAPIHVLHRTRAEAIEEAEAALSKVGLAEKRNNYPAQLSGGQQQRVAIARALAVRPKAMLFDEPTSALDPELVGEVLRVIRALAEEGRTMLLVTHEMRFAREVSTNVVFLQNGQIEEEGSPAQVFGDPVSARCKQFVNNQFA